MTLFADVYNSFLGKITDDMYMEFTPEDTVRDLQALLLDAIPDFEFPRKNLYDYKILTKEVLLSEVDENSDLILIKTIEKKDGTIWAVFDESCFNQDLTLEEIKILSLLMLEGWLQRQVSSVENIRMKYSGPDFKMTSQANHLSKLLLLLKQTKQQTFHSQRLYKRRKLTEQGYVSNWSSLNIQRSDIDGN